MAVVFSLQSLMDEIAAQRAGRTGPWMHLEDEPTPLENAAFVVDTIESSMEKARRAGALEQDCRHYQETSAFSLDLDEVTLSLDTLQEYLRDEEGLEHYSLSDQGSGRIEVIVDRQHCTVTVVNG